MKYVDQVLKNGGPSDLLRYVPGKKAATFVITSKRECGVHCGENWTQRFISVL